MVRELWVFKDTLDTWRPSWRGSNRPRGFAEVREERERTDSLSGVVVLLLLLFERLVAFRTRFVTAELIELCVRIDAVRACGSGRALTPLRRSDTGTHCEIPGELTSGWSTWANRRDYRSFRGEGGQGRISLEEVLTKKSILVIATKPDKHELFVSKNRD